MPGSRVRVPPSPPPSLAKIAALSELSSARPLPPGVHVILGDCAAEVFRRVFQPGDRLLIDRDVLSCGPTPRCDDLAVWCKVRSEFWNGVIAGLAPMPDDAFGLLSERERLRTAERITLWAATGLNEQLFIAHVVHRAEEMGIAAPKMRLIQFETMRNPRWPVLGTGELD